MLAQNLGLRALERGHTVRFSTLPAALADLLRQESLPAIERRLKRYTFPVLLILDELGYVPCDSRAADLLFHIISRGTKTDRSSSPPISPTSSGAPSSTRLLPRRARRPLHPALPPLDIDADSWRNKNCPASRPGQEEAAAPTRPDQCPTQTPAATATSPRAHDGLTGDRDRALLALGWFGAFRRAELVSLDAGDVVRGDEGLVATLRRSKGDQEGRGAAKGIPFASLPAVCPVRALARWLEASGIAEGPIFRGIDRHGHLQGERLHPSSVARIVKRCAERAGLPAVTAFSRRDGVHS